jgi:hypothetical protein
MNAEQLPTNRRFALWAALLAQIAHTVIILTSRMFIAFKPHPVLHGAHLEYLPWTERFPWSLTFVCIIALVVEIVIWSCLSKAKPCAWPYFVVMLAADGLYLLYLADASFHVFRGVDVTFFGVLDVFPFLAVIFGISGLLRSRKVFLVRPIVILPIILATLSSVAVIFLKGRYFPDGGGPQYIVSVPVYFDIVVNSGLQYPQESSMVLCVLLYALISIVFYKIKRVGW